VSLKILTASSSKELGFHEEEILRRIQNGPSHPGRCYLPEFLDSFVTESPHGKHKVLVTKVSGTSLSSVRDDAAMFTSLPTAPVKQWIREMLLALDYLHTHIRIIHSGIHLCFFRLIVHLPTT
jgi:serine/threonine-protein kinase SRPK3